MSNDLVVSVRLTAKDDGLQGTLQVDKDALDKLTSATREANKELSKQSAVSRALQTDLATLKNGIAALGIGALTRELAQSAVQMQGFEIGLKAATGSAEGSQRALAFVREESRRLGLDFQSAAASFTQLAAAARGTTLEGEGTRKIFTAVSEAARVLHLSNEATAGSLNAIQQMISKGTVSAEELRGQLGERLPGAFNIAARAIGVTTQQLDKMLQNGEVIASDFLPKFAAEVRKTFSGELSDAIDSADANFKRFGNAVFDLKVAFGKELLPTLVTVAQFFADTLIPTIAFAAEKIGLVEANINQMSEGQLRLKRDELSEDVAGRKRSLADSKAGRGSWSDPKALLGANAKDLAAIDEIDRKLKVIDERNRQIVKLGRERVEAEEAAARATTTTATATVKKATATEKAYDKERDSLAKRLALTDSNTEASRVLYETTAGALKSLEPAQKAELQRLAEAVDLKQDSADVEEYLRGVSLDREKAWATETKRLHAEALRDQKSAADKAAREAEQQAKREAEIVAEPFKNALRGVQDAFADAFANIFSGSVRSFGGLAKQIKQVFVRLAAEIASLLVFKPIMSNVLGAIGLTGMSKSLGLGGGDAGGALANLFGGGASGFNPMGLISGFQSEGLAGFGIGIADMLGLGEFGQSAFAGAGLNAPYALLGAGLNSLLGIDNGIGSTLGGLAGGGIGSTIGALGAFGGPVGAIAGTVLGGFISSLFGGKPKRKVSAADAIQKDGKFTVRDRGGPGGSSAAKGIVANLSAQLNELVKAGYTLNFRGGFGITEVTNSGKAGGSPFYLDFVPSQLRDGKPFQRQSFESADQLIETVVKTVLAKGIKETPEQKAQKARDKDQATSVLNSATVTNQYVTQVKAVIAQFSDLRKHAKDLGLSLADINKAERSQLGSARGSVVDEIRSAVAQGRQVLGIPQLEAFQQSLRFGDQAAGSPVEQLTAARTELRKLSKRALAGDVDAIQQFPGLAQTVLSIARDTYASGAGFQSVFRDVNVTLQQVLDKQRKLEASLLSNITITLQQNSADQIAAIKEQTTKLEAALKAIDNRLRKVGK